MANRDIVVVGASAGGVEALQVLAEGLPKDFKGSVFVVLHISGTSPNFLGQILDRAGELHAATAQDGEVIRPGRIYVAPADQHLLLDKAGFVRTTRGPKENRFRPAVDPLFRSAAEAFGSRVVGVVLTGFLDDGTAGLFAVKARGGAAIVQHPEEALASSMPLSALKNVEVDHICRMTEIAPLLVRFAETPASEKVKVPMSKELETEVRIASEDNAVQSGILEWGEPSLYACPECHGVLMQLKEGKYTRFRCHTGHAYSVESLMAELGDQTEALLWNAVRGIDEMVVLMRRMADLLEKQQDHESAAALRKKSAEAASRSERVRGVVLQQKAVQQDAELTAAAKRITATE